MTRLNCSEVAEKYKLDVRYVHQIARKLGVPKRKLKKTDSRGYNKTVTEYVWDQGSLSRLNRYLMNLQGLGAATILRKHDN